MHRERERKGEKGEKGERERRERYSITLVAHCGPLR